MGHGSFGLEKDFGDRRGIDDPHSEAPEIKPADALARRPLTSTTRGPRRRRLQRRARRGPAWSRPRSDGGPSGPPRPGNSGHWLAVILGASGRIRRRTSGSEACRLDGVEVARRSSGGGTVVIGPGALNVSVVLPVDAAPQLKNVDSAQRFILARMLEAIRRAGVPDAEMLGSGDLTLGARKFSGSAQRRLRRHVLVHASLLYDFPIKAIDRYTRMPPRRPAYREDRPHGEFVANLPLPRPRLLDGSPALVSRESLSESDISGEGTSVQCLSARRTIRRPASLRDESGYGAPS